MLETPSYLQTSVLNLLGHGAPLYIMSPDVSALTSLGPQGEMSILSKVTNVADFGSVITHSPFAELDYFRAASNLFKRLRFRLVFANGSVVNLHNANWSFSNIFKHFHAKLSSKKHIFILFFPAKSVIGEKVYTLFCSVYTFFENKVYTYFRK